VRLLVPGVRAAGPTAEDGDRLARVVLAVTREPGRIEFDSRHGA
jgi:hypothetical protein